MSASIFQKLALTPSGMLKLEHEQQLRAAGIDLDDALEMEGIDGESVHNACFFNEDIARAVIGSNLERIEASMRNCADTVESLAPKSVVDLGGGCGIVCFLAAERCPEVKFLILDRSQNALSVGRLWQERLELSNVSFHYFDLCDKLSVLPVSGQVDLILLEYVFQLTSGYGTAEILSNWTGAFHQAQRLLRPGGTVQVRFGEFDEIGIDALSRSATIHGLSLKGVISARDGYTCTFRNEQIANLNVDMESARILEEFSQAFWSQEPDAE